MHSFYRDKFEKKEIAEIRQISSILGIWGKDKGAAEK